MKTSVSSAPTHNTMCSCMSMKVMQAPTFPPSPKIHPCKPRSQAPFSLCMLAREVKPPSVRKDIILESDRAPKSQAT